MDESKIELTERLRREARWAEASKFKDAALADFRAKGMKRDEAAQVSLGSTGVEPLNLRRLRFDQNDELNCRHFVVKLNSGIHVTGCLQRCLDLEFAIGTACSFEFIDPQYVFVAGDQIGHGNQRSFQILALAVL